jgi:hypothetical protein
MRAAHIPLGFGDLTFRNSHNFARLSKIGSSK